MTTQSSHGAGTGPLLTPEELYELVRQQENVTVFDVRFHLGKPSEGRGAYLAGHIPNAYYLDLEQDLSGPVGEHGGRHPLPRADELARKLRATGVTMTSPVVFYDDGGGMATRGWWLLRYLGHPHVYVLDGGIAAWVDAGYPQSEEVPQPRTGDFEPSLDETSVVSVDQVERIARGEQSGILVDSRAEARYRGEVEPIDKVAGHIPTALNKPWEEALQRNGTWKSGEEQKERFADVLDSGNPIVIYCGSGVTACANLFALEVAGVKGAKLYPGSWSDWCSYPEHPVERGDTK